MMKNTLLLAVGALLLMSEFSFAQTDGTESGDIDQIVVTASRAPLSIDQVGSATTVISRQDIEQRQARYVTDLLRSVPGFSVSHTGVAGSQTQVRVRGAEANHVLVLIDGVRANDPATGDEFRWEFLSTGNIERIEIVRGPQSSLWGSDAVAAVVNVITQNGNQSGLGGYIEGGSDSTLNASLQGGVGSDGWHLAAGIERLATDGSNVSRNGDEDDDADLTTASLSARLHATDALTLDFGLRSVDAYSQFDPVDFFVTGLPADGDTATDTRQTVAQASGTLNTLGGRVVHRLAARYFDSNNRNLSDGIENSSAASDRLAFSFQSDISLGDNLLAIAVEHEQTSFEQRGAVVFGDPNQDQELDVTSFVVDYQGLSLDRLSWLLSARFDDNSDFDDALNGRLSLSYALSDALTLRANAGTGQKNPTFTERFGFFPGQFIGNPALKPERSTSIDVGIDRRFLHGALLLQLSLFRQDLKDEINGFVFDPLTFLATAENLANKSQRSGVEFGARWNVTDRLDLSGVYTYTDATEEGALGNDVRELRRPRHAASLTANTRFFADRTQLALTADYGGSRNDIFFPPFPNPAEVVTLDSHLLLELTAQYKISSTINLFARGSNLLDEDYEQVFGYRTPGRSAYVGLRINVN